MSSHCTPRQRETFAGIADYLIPNAEGMPSASEVDVHGAILDRVLGLRNGPTRAVSCAASDTCVGRSQPRRRTP